MRCEHNVSLSTVVIKGIVNIKCKQRHPDVNMNACPLFCCTSPPDINEASELSIMWHVISWWKSRHPLLQSIEMGQVTHVWLILPFFLNTLRYRGTCNLPHLKGSILYPKCLFMLSSPPLCVPFDSKLGNFYIWTWTYNDLLKLFLGSITAIGAVISRWHEFAYVALGRPRS